MQQEIRGKAGTEVILTIKKPNTGEVQDYSIIRDVITIKDIPFYGMVNDNVGYLRITNFSVNTANETKDALISLMQNGASNVIIDLRDNPGGLLSSSLDLLDLILPKNLELVSTKGRAGKSIKNYKTLNNALIPDTINMAVLINGASASASEIVKAYFKIMIVLSFWVVNLLEKVWCKPSLELIKKLLLKSQILNITYQVEDHFKKGIY